MDRDTFNGTIRALRGRNPFRPFTVVTVSGNRYEVDHGDAIVVREGVAVFVSPGGIPIIFDHDGVSEVFGDLSGQTTG